MSPLLKRLHSIDIETEQLILKGIIVSDRVIKELAPHLGGKDFELTAIQPPIKWILDYFGKYGVSPKGDIKQLFLINTPEIYRPKDEEIEAFLHQLSEEYKTSPQELDNEQFVIDEGIKYIQKQRTLKRLEKMTALAEAGEQGKVDEEWGKGKEEITTSSTVHHFQFVSVKELIETPPVSHRWLVRFLIPWAGSALVAAKAKVGKTTFSINLALAVAQGKPFLGKATEQCPVIYLGLEMSRNQITKILKNLGAKDEENLFLHCGRAPDQAMKEVRAMIQDRQANFLIVDMLQKFARIKVTQDYAEVTNAIEIIAGIASEENCATLFSHHLGKADRMDGDDILGSTAYLGGVDTAIIIKTTDPNLPLHKKRRTIQTISRSSEYDIERTVLTINKRGELGLGEKLSEAQGIDSANQLLEKMEQGEKYMGRELIDISQMCKDDFYRGIKWMMDEDLVGREGKGKKGSPYYYFKKVG